MKTTLKPSSLLLIAFLIFVGAACSDDEADAPVNTAPEITVVSPTDAELEAGFDRGETISIVGNVSDDDMISSINIEVLYGGTSLVEDEQTDINEKTYAFTQELEIPTLAPSGAYTVVFTATDNEGLSTTLEKTVQIN